MISKIAPWASAEVNFPPGPNAWNGAPVLAPPAQDYFTPGIALPAENVNSVLNARDKQLNVLLGGVYMTAAMNWHACWQQGTFPTQDIYGIAWDGYNNVWTALLQLGSPNFNPSIFISTDGLTWQNPTYNTSPLTSYYPGIGTPLAINPNTGATVLVRNFASGAGYVTYGTLFGGYHDVVQAALGTGAAVCNQGAVLFLNASFYFVGASGAGTSSTAGYAMVSPTSDGSGTWTSLTSSLPTSWATGTSNFAGWLTATNQTAIRAWVAACGMTPGGSDRSRILAVPAMTDVTPSFLSSGTEQIRGIAWSDSDQLLGVMTCDQNNFSGTLPNVRLYTTADAVTWTKVATLPNALGAGLATLGGGVWAIYMETYNANLVQNGILVSNNVSQGAGNVTWSRAAFADTLPLSGRPYPVGALVSSGQQLVAAAIQSSASTAPITISQMAGLPALPALGFGTSP